MDDSTLAVEFIDNDIAGFTVAAGPASITPPLPVRDGDEGSEFVERTLSRRLMAFGESSLVYAGEAVDDMPAVTPDTEPLIWHDTAAQTDALFASIRDSFRSELDRDLIFGL